MDLSFDLAQAVRTLTELKRQLSARRLDEVRKVEMYDTRLKSVSAGLDVALKQQREASTS